MVEEKDKVFFATYPTDEISPPTMVLETNDINWIFHRKCQFTEGMVHVKMLPLPLVQLFDTKIASNCLISSSNN